MIKHETVIFNMKDNSILKIKVLSYKNYDGYVTTNNELKNYQEKSNDISFLFERFLTNDVIYVPVNSILFFSGQKELFFLRKSETFYYFEMILNNGKKFFIPGKTEEVLSTLFLMTL